MNKKSQNLRLLCQRMKADRSERPNCDEIVETKKDWRLNESDLLIDYQSIINRFDCGITFTKKYRKRIVGK